MPAKQNFSNNQRNLIRRYLIWCYKTTKEDLDRIERYETQFIVDKHMLQCLQKGHGLNQQEKAAYLKRVDEFEKYLVSKKEAADKKKYTDPAHKDISPEYLYLTSRLRAIESSIVFFLGKAQLKKIVGLYEEEMTGRILTAREHT